MVANNVAQQQADERELDLLQLLKPLRTHWLTFLLLWVLFCMIGAGVVVMQRPVFQSAGSLYVEQRSEGPGVHDLTGFSSIFGSGSDLESDKELLKSKDLAAKVVRKLGFNGKVNGPAEYMPAEMYYWQWYLSRDPAEYSRGLVCRDSSVRDGVFSNVAYTVRFESPDRFTVSEDSLKLIQGRLGKPVQTRQASFTLVYRGGPPLEAGTEFEVVIMPARAVVPNFASALSVNSAGRGPTQANLIHLNYASPSPYRSTEALETLIEEFVSQKQSWATSVSRKMLEFVGEQIGELQEDMDQAATRLSEFQSDTGLVSLDPQVESELETLVGYEIQLNRGQMRLRELEQLAQSLASSKPELYLMAFVQDPLIQDMGRRLAEINSRIASLQSQYHEDYPELRQLRLSRESLQNDLRSMVLNYLEQARSHQAELQTTVDQYKDRLAKLPEQAKALTDFLRSSKVYEDLYLALAKEKQKAKVAEASTLSNLRVVDRPMIPLAQSSPRLLRSLVLIAAGSLFASALLVVLPALRVYWFTSVDEVKKQFGNPIFTVVPYRGYEAGRGSPEILENQPQSPFMESIRLLRANLLHAMAGRHQQTVLVTSAMPKDGKTLVATNLAAAMVKSERVDRVLLIDGDMHNPSMHGVFGLPQAPGLSDYLNGESTLDDVIQTVTLANGESLDVIVAGPVPPTPVDLVETEAMQRLIDVAKERYTFTIIDSPPYPITTTASVLAARVDRVLAVCRVGATDRHVFKRHVEELSELTKQFGLIVNTDASINGYGRYGTYGTYGVYGYGPESNGNGSSNGQSGQGRKKGWRKLLTKSGVS